MPPEPLRLVALPLELRNCIWEFVCTPDLQVGENLTDGYVDLSIAVASFPIHILLVCHRIHVESPGIFQSARDHFWRNNYFINRCKAPSDGEATVVNIDPLNAGSKQAFDRIQHLTICGPDNEPGMCRLLNMEWKDGLWLRNVRLKGHEEAISAYVVLISKAFRRWTKSMGTIPIKPERWEQVKGMGMFCRHWETHAGASLYADKEGKFRAICARPSESSRHIMQLISEDLGQQVLSKSQLEGIICSHVNMFEALER